MTKKTLSLLIVLVIAFSGNSGFSSEHKSKSTTSDGATMKSDDASSEAAEVKSGKSATKMKSKKDGKKVYETVAEVLRSRKEFSKFLEAVETARLDVLLESQSGMTVFAPTNKAFKEFPKETWNAVVKPINNVMLENLVTYHMVRGRVMAKDIETKRVRTLYGKDVKFRAENGLTLVGDAKVLKKDIKAKNGVVHAIDTVLVPPAL